MNISGVSSSTYSTSSSSSATNTKALEKQIASIQKEMAKVQADKTLDEKTKSQQVSVYQTQIQNLQAQVSKAQQDGSSQPQVQQNSGAQNAQGPEGAGKAKGPPPPPPEEMDFENMSDDDLKSFLGKMQEVTGQIPGIEDDTAASDLTSEQLQKARDTLTDMSSRIKEGGHKMGPPPDFVESLSDDDLKSLLNIIKESKGNIPGLEGSDDVDIDELTDEQLDAARTALSDMQQQRFQDSMRGRVEEMMGSSLAAQVNAAGRSLV